MEKMRFEPQTPAEKLLQKLAIGFGVKVRLTKKSAEQESGVQSGQVFVGRLNCDLKVGEPILLDDGTKTTSIQDASWDGRTLTLKTRTSTYELVLE